MWTFKMQTFKRENVCSINIRREWSCSLPSVSSCWWSFSSVSPTSSSSPVTQLAGSLDASPVCQPSWWTTVLLKVLQYIKNVFFIFCFYVLFVWKYYKPITVQYYIGDCVSWGPVLCAESLSRVWLILTPWLPGCPWDSPGKNIGVDCHAFLQGILLT